MASKAEQALFPSQQSSGMPSMAQLLSLKMRQNYNQEQTQSRAAYSQSTRGRANADRIIRRFEGLKNPAQQHMFAEMAFNSPDSQKAFADAGLDMKTLLAPMELSHEQKVSEAGKAKNVAFDVQVAHEETDVQSAEMDAQRQMMAKEAAYNSPAGKRLREAQIKDQMDASILQAQATAEARDGMTMGFYEDANGELQQSTKANAAAIDATFLPADTSKKRYDAQMGYKSQRAVALSYFNGDTPDIDFTTGEVISSDGDDVFGNDTSLGRGNSARTFYERMFKNYMAQQSAKTLPLANAELMLYERLMLNKPIKAGELGAGRAAWTIEQMKAKLFNSALNQGGPSPFAFVLDYEERNPEEKKRGLGKAIWETIIGKKRMPVSRNNTNNP